eukprot:UN26093
MSSIRPCVSITTYLNSLMLWSDLIIVVNEFFLPKGGSHSLISNLIQPYLGKSMMKSLLTYLGSSPSSSFFLDLSFFFFLPAICFPN